MKILLVVQERKSLKIYFIIFIKSIICLLTESLALFKFKDNAAINDPLFIKELVSVVNQAL